METTSQAHFSADPILHSLKRVTKIIRSEVTLGVESTNKGRSKKEPFTYIGSDRFVSRLKKEPYSSMEVRTSPETEAFPITHSKEKFNNTRRAENMKDHSR